MTVCGGLWRGCGRMAQTYIRFTPHAIAKFEELRGQGFEISEEAVIETVLNPVQVVSGHTDRTIAQSPLREHLLLRVVYDEVGDTITVITFYPAERSRYEDHQI